MCARLSSLVRSYLLLRERNGLLYLAHGFFNGTTQVSLDIPVQSLFPRLNHFCCSRLEMRTHIDLLYGLIEIDISIPQRTNV